MQTQTTLSGGANLQVGFAAQLHRLSNGMQVVLLEDHSAPVVAMQTWVRFGSADEEATLAGIAHVFEHMLFKGTKRFPNGEIAALIEGAGGTVNAWTSYDETVYHVTIASRFWEIGFDVLSDAVLYSLFDAGELAKEKEVVLEELWRGKDNPDREISEQLFALSFTAHPYQRPIIGYEKTVQGIEREDMLRVFETWYVPNNMIFVAVGDFDTPRLLQSIEARFGAVEGRKLPNRKHPEEPAQTAPRTVVMPFQAELARVEIAFSSVAASDSHAPTLDILSDVLGSGYNSALYTELKRRRELAHDVYAYHYALADRGLFVLGASCAQEQTADVVRALMQQACEQTLKLSEHDLAAAKTRMVSQFVHARETYQGIAGQLGRFTMIHDDPNYGLHYVASIETLGVDTLRRAGERYLRPECANLALLAPQQATLPKRSMVLSWMQERRAPSFAVQRLSPLPADVDVLQLPGGSRLVVQTDRKTPLVSIRALCDGGQRVEPTGKEGLARLLTSVWDRGTLVRGAGEIEREIDRLGAVLSAANDRDTIQLGARFLKETFADGMDLFFDILTAPSFAEQEVGRERTDQLRELESLKEHRPNFAFQHFLQIFYGSHPYRHLALGSPGGLATVGRDDLLAFHRALLQPHKMVYAVVGDIATQDVLDTFERLAPLTLLEALPASAQSGSALPIRDDMAEQIIELPGQQTHIVWGFPAVTIRHPDRYALRVLDTILGGQGGRLFVELRDRKSLAYSVTSFDAYPVEQGFFALYIACTPDKESEALEAFERIIEEVKNDGVSPEELKRAQTYLEGVVDIGLQSSSQRTAVYGMGELHSGGWDAYKEYLRVVQQMTTAEVQQVARTYLDPRRSVRVILRAI